MRTRLSYRLVENASRLLETRRLSLIVDLDQTIIHAAFDPTVGEWMKDENNANHPATRVSWLHIPDRAFCGLAHCTDSQCLHIGHSTVCSAWKSARILYQIATKVARVFERGHQAVRASYIHHGHAELR
jgi:TFIIF-interacting CTD phosphatase-like protein